MFAHSKGKRCAVCAFREGEDSLIRKGIQSFTHSKKKQLFTQRRVTKQTHLYNTCDFISRYEACVWYSNSDRISTFCLIVSAFFAASSISLAFFPFFTLHLTPSPFLYPSKLISIGSPRFGVSVGICISTLFSISLISSISLYQMQHPPSVVNLVL